MELWLGLYGAGLSTALALSSLVAWLLRIRLTVYGIHPYEAWSGSCGAIVVNSGRRPTSVREIEFEAYPSRWTLGAPLWSIVADHRDLMDPALQKVPVHGKENTFQRVPNVLTPGSEYFGETAPNGGYLPDTYWLRVSAFARGRRFRFTNWVAPKTKEAP